MNDTMNEITAFSPFGGRLVLEEVFQAADELKVVIGDAEDLLWAEQCAARAGKSCRLYLQPEWSRFAEAVRLITEYVKAHPQWKVSLQTHKFMEIP